MKSPAQQPLRVFEYGFESSSILEAAREGGVECRGVEYSDGRSDVPSEWADIVYSYSAPTRISALSHFTTALEEIARILKPGGHLKLRFRSTERHDPRLPWFRREFLINGQDRTWFFRIGTLKRLHPALRHVPVPRVGRYRHHQRVGLPLSIPGLRALLRQVSIETLHVEQDDGPFAWLYWVTGQKKGR